jgi:hypothetical protein
MEEGVEIQKASASFASTSRGRSTSEKLEHHSRIHEDTPRPDFERVAERVEDRAEQVVLFLGLVVAGNRGADNRVDCGESLGGGVGEQLPLGARYRY